MKSSLYLKLLLSYLLFALLGFAAIATFSSRLTRNYLIAEQAEILYDEAAMIARTCGSAYNGGRIDKAVTTNTLGNIAAYLQCQIWIAEKDGTIVVDSSHLHEGEVIPGFNPAASGSKLYTVDHYYGMFNYDVLNVTAPITGNMTTYGYVIAHLPMRYILRRENRFLNVLYITGGVLFAISLLILLAFVVLVSLPLRKIMKGADEFSKGNFEYHIPVKSHDEIGRLAAELNYMAGRLQDMEKSQATFIANVSHDFRSPLTSIKGYLEAILDGTIPPELYEKYLGIVISETERLHKLTEGMLTLNSLNSSRILTRSNFDINRTVKDTAASFEGRCVQKGISFDLTFADDIQPVHADLGKIQQVLYNLIDNAIKFSKEDSVIYIRVYPTGEKVFVSVKDTGAGIPKESLPRIWDRFYKSDRSRGKDKTGTGLGLSIVKEIIQAHGENIDCISTEGIGTEFIFSLPRAGE